MANSDSGGRIKSVLHEIGITLSDMFGGGRLDAKKEVSLSVLFGLLGALARADSIVTSHETDLVNDLMDEFKLSTKARALALDSFDRGRKAQLTLQGEVDRFHETFPLGSPQAASLFDSLVRLAAADDRIRPRERAFLEELTIRLGYDAGMLGTKLKQYGQPD